MPETDWGKLWRELVERFSAEPAQGDNELVARWSKRVRSAGFTDEQRRRDRDDPLMRFVLSKIQPADTVLDVGAGIGRWSIPMAMKARSVTAIDALPGMLDILRENARDEGVDNIETVLGDWSGAEPETHDHVLASHSAYTSPDIVGYARWIAARSRKACYMALRVPQHDGVIGELSDRIHGCWHDSPNFVVGYNALLQAGIYGAVVMDESVKHWHDANLEDALARAKRHLRLHSDDHDADIADALERRLAPHHGGYSWPDGMRSALIWWRTNR
ncbi:MAG: class I SAM-dependent methyltransferase [SAR202 cluster bacterium]|jgi:SAM-dependent methyltransferase|nr:class I SAM-dependent methyltransferase [SAR202 cluster bacterium]MDP6663252.1 class I SAM-dependent methyltransferase [SAR202 cluster bacterium]MQG56630.1 class I SAM-dependent methyltransferase [SAR202 cluster bacterium]MQG67275.1 class I SAM-dependent methyltransferase [SAR202 cluster bacterium]HAL46828.1 hypothetical protein [Dehalococcoidia bacterium]|tara:strand:- start:2466 stop:3287 length:822 start_codon:yes stop_codon:yes gene_type:complete